MQRNKSEVLQSFLIGMYLSCLTLSRLILCQFFYLTLSEFIFRYLVPPTLSRGSVREVCVCVCVPRDDSCPFTLISDQSVSHYLHYAHQRDYITHNPPGQELTLLLKGSALGEGERGRKSPSCHDQSSPSVFLFTKNKDHNHRSEWGWRRRPKESTCWIGTSPSQISSVPIRGRGLWPSVCRKETWVGLKNMRKSPRWGIRSPGGMIKVYMLDWNTPQPHPVWQSLCWRVLVRAYSRV